MNISCIILNYNDGETTMELVEQICGYDILDSIVVVDNCSTDDSRKSLKALAGKKVHVIGTERNGGYGYGNNQGILYAVEKLGATHVLIANPDIKVSEACICSMKKAFESFDHLAVSAAVTTDPAGVVQLSSFPLRGIFMDMLDTGIITRRLFKRILGPNPELEAQKEQYAFVDCVLGSFFLADVNALLECGLYDEEVFLYYEEKILGIKLKEKGYRTVLLLDQRYIHNHSVSIDKSVKSLLKKQKLRHKSQLHFYKKYLFMNRAEELFVSLAMGVIMAEIWFLTRILKLSW